MCFYQRFGFSCQHSILWIRVSLCTAARQCPKPKNTCQIRSPVGPINFENYGYDCPRCVKENDMYGSIVVQQPQGVGGGNEGSKLSAHGSSNVSSSGYIGGVQAPLTRGGQGTEEGGHLAHKSFGEGEGTNVSTNQGPHCSSSAGSSCHYSVHLPQRRVEEQRGGAISSPPSGENKNSIHQKHQPQGLPSQLSSLSSGLIGPQLLNRQQPQRLDAQNFQYPQQQQQIQAYQRLYQQEDPQLERTMRQRFKASSLGNNQIRQQQPKILHQEPQAFHKSQHDQQPQNFTKRGPQQELQDFRTSHTPVSQTSQGPAKRHCTSIVTPVMSPVSVTPYEQWEDSTFTPLGPVQPRPNAPANPENYVNHQLLQSIPYSGSSQVNTPPWSQHQDTKHVLTPRPEPHTPQHAPTEETPYFHYPFEFMHTERQKLQEQVMAHDAIVASMKAFNPKRVGTEPLEALEALDYVKCQDLYQNILKQETTSYRDEIWKYQKRSKELLDSMTKGNLLGSAQFWQLASQKSRELRGRCGRVEE